MELDATGIEGRNQKLLEIANKKKLETFFKKVVQQSESRKITK